MKKWLVRLGVVFGGLLLCLLVAFYVMFGNNPPIVDGQDLGGVRVVKDGYVACFLADLGAGDMALIDACNDPKGTAILAALSASGLGPQSVKAIFLTHGHPDHIAGISNFPQAKIYALRAEVPLVEGKVGAHGPLTQWFPPNSLGLKVTDPVEDGQVLTLGTRSFEVFSVPGHTAGSAAWLTGGYLFLGDSADGTKDGKMVGAKYIFTDDPAENAASLHALSTRLASREIKGLAFAHTGTMVGGAALGGW